jgi:hypothetical protein
MQFVWLLIKERAPFSLQEHRTLFWRINLVYRTQATAQLEAWPTQLDAAFARCVVEYFEGSPTQNEAEFYEFALATYVPISLDVRFQTRVFGLAYLLRGEHEG